MLTKNEILNMLHDAIAFEEKRSRLLEEKCMACLHEISQSEMIDQDKRKMRRMLSELVSDSRAQQEAFKELAQKVKENGKDDF